MSRKRMPAITERPIAHGITERTAIEVDLSGDGPARAAAMIDLAKRRQQMTDPLALAEWYADQAARAPMKTTATGDATLSVAGLARQVREHVATIRAMLASGGSDLAGVMRWSFALGGLVNELRSKGEFEPDVLRARKQRAALPKAHDGINAKRKAEAAAKREQWLAADRELNRPGRPCTERARSIKARYGFTESFLLISRALPKRRLGC